ncbi:hypothetical protein HY450_02840 [Candidatus Pacearchaeota archaeon]|nr:hypothetical protein [Candidatus Pacearchaeota archaeon]
MKNKKVIIFILIGVIFIALSIRFSFFHSEKCESFECFQDEMRKCSKATYVADESEATWKYEILGKKNNGCAIEVTLLQPKTGEVEIENLKGYGMECIYPEGFATYPERDLERCSGKLKEELQTMIIKKLHTYIVQNLGEIDENLNLVVT